MEEVSATSVKSYKQDLNPLRSICPADCIPISSEWKRRNGKFAIRVAMDSAGGRNNASGFLSGAGLFWLAWQSITCHQNYTPVEPMRPMR